jgi:hypothetical protein
VICDHKVTYVNGYYPFSLPWSAVGDFAGYSLVDVGPSFKSMWSNTTNNTDVNEVQDTVKGCILNPALSSEK